MSRIVLSAMPSKDKHISQHKARLYERIVETLADIEVDSEGFGWLPEDGFLAHFAPDIDTVTAKVMFAVQQPLHTSTFDDVMGTPAWKALPSWYLVAQHDQVIPPDAERQFATRMDATVIELASSHVGMVSHPDEVADLIDTAARAVS